MIEIYYSKRHREKAAGKNMYSPEHWLHGPFSLRSQRMYFLSGGELQDVCIISAQGRSQLSQDLRLL